MGEVGRWDFCGREAERDRAADPPFDLLRAGQTVGMAVKRGIIGRAWECSRVVVVWVVGGQVWTVFGLV